MSTEQATLRSGDAAAEAFYGQDEDSFAVQLKKLGAHDPRLIRAFERTRLHYLEQKAS